MSPSEANWMLDFEGKPIPIEFSAILRYFDRAAFSYAQACSDRVTPEMLALCLAFCTHACQSLREALDRFADSKQIPQLKGQLAKLPHASVIESIRHSDLHGYPIPVCPPGVSSVLTVAGSEKPMRLSSQDGVAVTVQMQGAKPKVKLSPKDQKHGKFTPGQAASYFCDCGELIVHDFSTSKDVRLLPALREFLEQVRLLVLELAEANQVMLHRPESAS